MKDLIRLDKYLADMAMGTRSEVKNFIKKGLVSVNGQVITRPEYKVDLKKDQIEYDGRAIIYESEIYYMLNKPAGVITATDDRHQKTVLDLLPDDERRDIFPVGRLDKDTEGLLLLTNNGSLAHHLLSPKRHVSKVYQADIEGLVTKRDIDLFAAGLVMDETWTALPAELEIIRAGERSEVFITIYEGKYHQIKRMFEVVDKSVLTLKRLSMGPLRLDESLAPGEYRRLTETEIRALKASVGQ